MKSCPKCKKLANYNYYFKKYFCEECDWEATKQDKQIPVEIIKQKIRHKVVK